MLTLDGMPRLFVSELLPLPTSPLLIAILFSVLSRGPAVAAPVMPPIRLSLIFPAAELAVDETEKLERADGLRCRPRARGNSPSRTCDSPGSRLGLLLECSGRTR